MSGHRSFLATASLALAGLLTVRGAALSPSQSTLAVPGRTNANVSLASQDDFVAAAWSAALPDGTTDIYAASSVDGGRAFTVPVRVNRTPGDARVNGEQPPRAALVRRPSGPPLLTIVWTSKGKDGTTIVTAQSDDGGRTFGETTLVPGGEAAGNRAGRTCPWTRRARCACSGSIIAKWRCRWRRLARTSSRPRCVRCREEGQRRRRAAVEALHRDDRRFLVPAAVARRCLLLLQDGHRLGRRRTLYAAWRHVFPGNLRDIAFMASRDGGRTFGRPIRVSEDQWHLEGCPDDGPAMAVDAANTVHLVWPTLVTDGPQGQPSIGIFYATSAEGGAFRRVRASRPKGSRTIRRSSSAAARSTWPGMN
jgi:hypothetical protein